MHIQHGSDKQKEYEDMKGLPMLDSTTVVTWSKKFKWWLMCKKLIRLGLEKDQNGQQRTRSRESRVESGRGHVCECNL